MRMMAMAATGGAGRSITALGKVMSELVCISYWSWKSFRFHGMVCGTQESVNTIFLDEVW